MSILISYEVCSKNFPLSYGIAQVINLHAFLITAIIGVLFLFSTCTLYWSEILKPVVKKVKSIFFITVVSFRNIIQLVWDACFLDHNYIEMLLKTQIVTLYTSR